LFKELSPDDYDNLKEDGIPVMITIENDTDQIHQDFADCSKTVTKKFDSGEYFRTFSTDMQRNP
jgi:hypothetical protein